jgi:Transcriptional regulator PadR-like family
MNHSPLPVTTELSVRLQGGPTGPLAPPTRRARLRSRWRPRCCGADAGRLARVMYPILGRMLEEGWLADGWEDQAQLGRAKRPPRRYYELTAEGKTALGAVVAAAGRDARFSRGIRQPAVGGI